MLVDSNRVISRYLDRDICAMSKTLSRYLCQIHDATSTPGTYAYRGQANSCWPLHSAATRHLTKGSGVQIDSEDFIDRYLMYHRQTLIDPSRIRGFDVDSGRTVSDLHVLAKLQHFGAPTGLLDFTWNPLVALWFAGQEHPNGNSGSPAGTLFFVNTTNTEYMDRIPVDEESQTIDKVFTRLDNSAPRLSFWEPTLSDDAMLRILRQRSVFIIGRPLIPKDDSVIGTIMIKPTDKNSLRQDLASLDITQVSLFMDFVGFAKSVTMATSSEQEQDPEHYLIQGNRFYQHRHYQEAIAAYDRSITLQPEVCESYFLRGNAKAATREYDKAIEDYESAISHKARPCFRSGANPNGQANDLLPAIFYNRANAKAELERFEEAVKDYTCAIRRDTGFSESYYNRGNAYCELNRFDKAVQDYDDSIRRGSHHAFFNKGNALVSLGKFDCAIQCYFQSENKGVNDAASRRNRIASTQVLNRIRGRAYCLTRECDTGDYSRCVVVKIDDQSADPLELVFAGSIGNSGNRGGHGRVNGDGLDGGEGGGGRLPFVVKVESRR